MTPENDVKKENDVLENEPATSDESTRPVDEKAAEANSDATDSVTDDLQDEMQDDMDRAVAAQDVATDEGADEVDGAAAASTSDDPLGFGDTRMAGDQADGPGESRESAGSDEQVDAAEASVEGGESEIDQLRTQLEQAESKASTHWDQLLRLQAEMENQRKRAQNDVNKAHKFALENFTNDILPVKDSLEMGIQAATGEDAEPEKIIEGSELTLKMLTQALEKYNIVEINPIDEKFDPEFHQAMSMQPVEGKEPNTVSSVLQKGYTLNDRLIRPALVMVVK